MRIRVCRLINVSKVKKLVKEAGGKAEPAFFDHLEALVQGEIDSISKAVEETPPAA
jgi:hypothetical protein